MVRGSSASKRGVEGAGWGSDLGQGAAGRGKLSFCIGFDTDENELARSPFRRPRETFITSPARQKKGSGRAGPSAAQQLDGAAPLALRGFLLQLQLLLRRTELQRRDLRKRILDAWADFGLPPHSALVRSSTREAN